MAISLSDISKQLPPQDTSDYRSSNRILFNELNRTCVVIDDDPTGNQTVYDIPLLTEWDVETLLNEFKNATPAFFLLTNSRSLSHQKSSKIYREISENIIEVSKLSNRDFTIVSRSDSTLRGHFSEIEIIKEAGHFKDAVTFFIPVMFEGGRVTANDVHYISEKEKLVPVNETPFSKDHTFSYSSADLKSYIQEKTKGSVKASDVFSFDLESLRTLDVETLSARINDLNPGKYSIVNALNYNDLDKFSQAVLLAQKFGKQILFRTSSSFVPSYIGLKPQPLLTSENIINPNFKPGGLIIVGSYVPKSSSQLKYVLDFNEDKVSIEVDVETVLSKKSESYLAAVSSKIDDNIVLGKDVIVYTSRKLITGTNADSNINIASKVSQALVSLVQGMQIRPKYLLAKGGITSHDLAIKGLGMKRSKVLGQIQPGIPVWEMGEETKFPQLLYIVFPGNVGDEKSLLKIIQKLS